MIAVRQDLAEVNRQTAEHISAPGTWFTGAERLAIADVTLQAIGEVDHLAPWVAPSSDRSRFAADLDDAALDAAYRIACHSSTLTESWYQDLLQRGLEPPAYVELVAVVVCTAALASFADGAGVARTPHPQAGDGVPSRLAPSLEASQINWVQVATPADGVPAIEQSLSAVPLEWRNWERLHGALYIALADMGNLNWNRGTLTRPQMELIAARVSVQRECFY